MSTDRRDRYEEPLPGIRELFGGEVLSGSRSRTSLGHRDDSIPRQRGPGYTRSPISSHQGPLPFHYDRRHVSPSAQTQGVRPQSPIYQDPTLKLPPLRLASEPASPPRQATPRIASPRPQPAPPPAPQSALPAGKETQTRELPRVPPKLALSPPGYERQPLTKPYAPTSPPPLSGRSKSPKPSVLVHYRLNPPVPEGAPDIYTYATPTGAPQPSTGPVNYSFTVMREQQGDLIDVRKPSPRAQGILRPTAILEDEDQSHKRYKCDFPGCDKKYDRPSSLEVHRHTHSGNLRESHDTRFRPYRPNPADLPSSNQAFTCDHPGCGRKFGVKSNMLRHFRTHHGKKDVAPSSERMTITPYGEQPQEDSRFFHNMARDPNRTVSPPAASSSRRPA